MGKLKNKSSNYKVIDDWKDFDKSKLMSLSADYYCEKGIDAFSRVKSSNIIPSETFKITTPSSDILSGPFILAKE